MKYTLYIDESGDFKSQRGQWVVSGILLHSDFDQAEKQLAKYYKDIPYKLNLNSIRDFHLTEFRSNFGHQIAVSMAKETISALNNTKLDYSFFAVVNYSKVSLPERELTYRQMLADMIAMCEISLSETEIIDSLDIVIASRTIDGILQTTISNVKNDVIKSLPTAFEVGLATKGLIALLGNKINVHMDYANNSWGLVCADFIANITYNAANVYEHEYILELEQKGKYYVFESFGNYEIRRAKIAERDNDFVAALYRWLTMSNSKYKEQRISSIDKVLMKIIDINYSKKAKASIDAVLEKLWRNYRTPEKYADLAEILTVFANRIDYILNRVELYKYFLHLSFRTKNMLIMILNHIGDVDNAKIYANQQNINIEYLISNPEYFSLILDYKVHEIEILINDMNFEQAYRKSLKYYDLICGYKTVWELLLERNVEKFDESTIKVKAEMILIRSEILHNHNPDFCTVQTRIDNLHSHLLLKYDISRLNNYRIMYYIKSGQPDQAIAKGILSDNSNDFDLLWYLHAINDCFLRNILIKLDYISTVEKYINIFNTKNKDGHPADLVMREIALFYYFKKDLNLAKKAIKKSKKACNIINSAISIFLSNLLDMHNDFICGQINSSALLAARMKSPY